MAAAGDEVGRRATRDRVHVLRGGLAALPVAGAPEPVLDLVPNTLDRCAVPRAARAAATSTRKTSASAIANEVLSIGIAPVLAETVPPLPPLGAQTARDAAPRLVYEVIDRPDAAPGARWSRLTPSRTPTCCPRSASSSSSCRRPLRLTDGDAADPLLRGVDDLPPRIDDDQLRARLVTWVRIRLAPDVPGQRLRRRPDHLGRRQREPGRSRPCPSPPSSWASGAASPTSRSPSPIGPCCRRSLRLGVEGDNGLELWRQVDDLAGLAYDDPAFTLDPAGGNRDLRRSRGCAARGRRGAIFASYEYGGGLEGNVAIGGDQDELGPADRRARDRESARHVGRRPRRDRRRGRADAARGAPPSRAAGHRAGLPAT